MKKHAFQITQIQVNYPDKSERNQHLTLPNRWELLDTWEIRFDCPGCHEKVIIKGAALTPPDDGENLHFIKTIHPKWYTEEEVHLINSFFKRTIIEPKYGSIKLKEVSSYPNFAAARCNCGQCGFLFTYLLGIGMEDRPPRPNLLYVDEMVGIDQEILFKLLKGNPFEQVS